MHDEIRLSTVMAYWIITILLYAFSRAKPIPDPVKWILILSAIVFFVASIVISLDWLSYRAITRIKEANYARNLGSIQLACSLKGLDRTQTEMIRNQMLLEANGLDNVDGEIIWTVRAPQGDIQLALIDDYLSASEGTYPYLFPIHQHTEFRQAYGWEGAEQWLTILSRFFIWQGYAEQASGAKSAKLKVTMPWIREHFRL